MTMTTTTMYKLCLHQHLPIHTRCGGPNGMRMYSITGEDGEVGPIDDAAMVVDAPIKLDDERDQKLGKMKQPTITTTSFPCINHHLLPCLQQCKAIVVPSRRRNKNQLIATVAVLVFGSIGIWLGLVPRQV